MSLGCLCDSSLICHYCLFPTWINVYSPHQTTTPTPHPCLPLTSVGRWHQQPSSWFSTFFLGSPLPPVHPLLSATLKSITAPLEGQCRGWCFGAKPRWCCKSASYWLAEQIDPSLSPVTLSHCYISISEWHVLYMSFTMTIIFFKKWKTKIQNKGSHL